MEPKWDEFTKQVIDAAKSAGVQKCVVLAAGYQGEGFNSISIGALSFHERLGLIKLGEKMMELQMKDMWESNKAGATDKEKP